MFDSFDYRAYLASQGVHARLRAEQIYFVGERAGSPAWQALYDFKDRAQATLAALFPEPHAALLTGILLGVESGIPPEVEAAFRATGTSHIVAISGFNIAILAGFVSAGAFRLLGRGRGLVVTVLCLGAYALLVGASGSVVRAAIMGGAALLARQIGRRAHGLNTLAAALFLMTLGNPLWLWDAGLQLSAGATLGLVLYAGPLEAAVSRWLSGRAGPGRAQRLAALASELVLLTVAAQLTALPLVVYHFRALSLVSLPANLLIVPVQPAVMVLGGLALVAGLVWLPLGQLVAWLAWPFAAYTLVVARDLAEWPAAVLYLGEVTAPLVALYYAALFGAGCARRRMATAPAGGAPTPPGGLARHWLPAGGLAVLSLGTILAWSYFASLPAHPDRLRVTVLDIAPPEGVPGGGEAVLIQAPGGQTALVGGGPGGLTLVRALDRNLSLLGRELDVAVVAAPDPDHLAGLPEAWLRRPARRVVLTSAAGDSTAYRVLLDRLRAGGVEVVDARTRPVLDFGGGISLRVLADTEQGSVLRLAWGGFALLLAPGLEAATESELAAAGLIEPATALLLAHGGDNSASSEEWLRAANPQLVLISAAGDAPAPEVLARLAGRNVLRTDAHGDIVVETDGAQMWVTVNR
jgi:competence protein ComEC